MTTEQREKVIEIYGPDYEETDVPTIIRQKEAEAEDNFLSSIEDEWKDK